jgi:hypothetical protein
LQFRLRIPLQQRDHIRSGIDGLCDGCTHSSRQFPHQLQRHRGNGAINSHHRQAAQPLHRHAAGGISERKAPQQFPALGCMDEQPQGAMLSPLASRGSAWFMQGWKCLRMGLARAGLAETALQCLLQPLFRRPPQHPIGQLLDQSLTGLFDRLESLQ